MSFLNLRRLLPPRLKMWKSLKNKLQTKIRKLNSSKAIEKPRSLKSCKTLKKIRWPIFLSINQQKKFKVKPKHQTLIHLNKITPLAALAKESKVKNHRPNHTRKKEPIYTVTSSDDEANNKWECVSSPQTQGIDERADEFIARFRAQMHHQELMLPPRNF